MSLKLVITICFLLGLAGVFPAQETIPEAAKGSAETSLPSLKNVPATEVFISGRDKFSIAVTGRTDALRILKTDLKQDISETTSTYLWQFAEGDLLVYRTAGHTTPFKVRYPFDAYLGMLKRSLGTLSSGAAVSDLSIKLATFKGRELILKDSAGTVITCRTYFVNKEFYLILAVTKPAVENSEKLVLRALDSFRITAEDKNVALAAEYLARITPELLPQTPVPPGGCPDTIAAGLKGRVRSTMTELRGLPDDESSNPFADELKEYDERGFLTRNILYDKHGLPAFVYVYGFMENSRVDRVGYSSDRERAKVTPSVPYDTRTVCTADGQGRPLKSESYRSNGAMYLSAKYTYGTGTRESSVYWYPDMPPVSKTVFILDSKGNEISATTVRDNKEVPDKTTTKYEAFDEKGNWIKKSSAGTYSVGGGPPEKFSYTAQRTINYYP